MIITVPKLIRKQNVEGSIETTRELLKLEVDTSFKAHLKWEKYFMDQLDCDLNTYYERVSKWMKDPKSAKANMIGMLKLLYCYVNSDQLPTFIDFLGMFDVAVADEILTAIGKVLTEVQSTVSKN
jgi:uncharacterized membrane protein YkvA (DUF1232 family)